MAAPATSGSSMRFAGRARSSTASTPASARWPTADQRGRGPAALPQPDRAVRLRGGRPAARRDRARHDDHPRQHAGQGSFGRAARRGADADRHAQRRRDALRAGQRLAGRQRRPGPAGAHCRRADAGLPRRRRDAMAATAGRPGSAANCSPAPRRWRAPGSSGWCWRPRKGWRCPTASTSWPRPARWPCTTPRTCWRTRRSARR